MRPSRWIPALLIAVAAALTITSTPASAIKWRVKSPVVHKQPLLHVGEAELVETHVTYGQANKYKAFRVALGKCIRQDRQHVDCASSIWRDDKYGVQVKGNLLIHVNKFHRKGRDVRHTLDLYWVLAKPAVPEPTPSPTPAPGPAEPTYPNYPDGQPYQPK